MPTNADLMATPYSPNTLYMANPAANTESLLTDASETLGSETVMLNNHAAQVEGTAPQDFAGHCASGDGGGNGGQSRAGPVSADRVTKKPATATVMVRWRASFCGVPFSPHPSPLPEGEGAERGILIRYADLKVLL
jgi:hypothetical protein